jgi:hypothetical protein
VRLLRVVAALGALAAGTAGCGGGGATQWRFSADAGVRIRDAVSTEALRGTDGSILVYANTLTGIEGYRSGDGLSLRRVAGRMPLGGHPTVVALPDGRLRMYYATPADLPFHPSQLRSAISRDGVFWFLEDGVRFGDVGFGVMEIVRLPDGTWRLYFNDRRLDGSSRVLSARSTRGLTYHRERGVRLPAPYVDPAVVRVGPRGWLMAVATLEHGRRQRIFLAESRNGVDWRVDAKPIVSDSDASVFDPTLLPLGGGRFRLYYTRSQGKRFEVLSGVLGRT